MILHDPALVTIEPVDVNFAIAVADVEEHRAIAARHQLDLAQDTVEARRSDDHLCFGERRGEGCHTATKVQRLKLACGIAFGHGDDGAKVARPFCDAAPHRSEADDEDPSAKQRETRDALEGGLGRLADVEAVVERVLEGDAVPVEYGEG